jgi:hypothetical protein
VPEFPCEGLPEFMLSGGFTNDVALRKIEHQFGGLPELKGNPEVFYTAKKPKVGLGVSVKFNLDKKHYVTHMGGVIKSSWMNGLINWVSNDRLTFKAVVKNNVDHEGNTSFWVLVLTAKENWIY